MLDEILACFLSMFSALALDAPHLSLESNRENRDESRSALCIRYTWGKRNHRSFDQYIPLLRAEYVHCCIESLLKSLKVTFSITLAVFPVAFTGMTLMYFELRTTDLCHEWQARNHALSFDVKRIRLIGRGLVVTILYLWIPFTLIVLFGWSEFRRHYCSTILVGQLLGSVNTLYLSILLLYGIDDEEGKIESYFVPAYLLFVVAVLWECVIVVRKVQENIPAVSYSCLHIFMVIPVPYLSSLAMAMFYNYAVVSWFNSMDNDFYRFVLAMLTPTLAVVPTSLCRHMALWRTSEIIEPGRSFALVYFIRGVFITLYRIMQVNFRNVWLFVGLSLLSGASNLLKAVTVGIRNKVWARIIKFLNKTCCARLRHLPGGTVRHMRLKADTEIQNILFENISLILSQSYIILYTITSFELSDWSVVGSSLIRIAIGLGIEFAFSILSTFVRLYWYDIPMAQVWFKYWKRHVFANAIAVAVLVCYFTKPLLKVFENRYHDTSVAANYTVRNCTLPYQSWR